MPPISAIRLIAALGLAGCVSVNAAAQPPEPTTREAAIAEAQAEKVKTLHPYEITGAERLMAKAEAILAGGGMKWHPFFESAYRGGGFAFGAGYAHYVSPYNFIDVRGSYTLAGYKRAEVEFDAPRLFHRRGNLSLLGGWREATQVGFFGLGPDSSIDNQTNYSFRQPYASALLSVKPARKLLLLQGGAEWTQWQQRAGEGTTPSVETRYTPATLPGVGAKTTYLHTQGTVGLDWRTSPGYSRRGGYYGLTFHDFSDPDEAFGFQQLDYELIQHFPILRETWVISLHGLASTTMTKSGQEIPFFMLPSLGGGSNLRGYDSWRFRDRNSLLLQAEWRIMANRFLDTALFYDAGKVTRHTDDLDFNDLKHDYGFGIRFHGPFATPLRVDIAHSNESSYRLVFTSSAVF
jgi:hypothetical protein